MTAFEPARREQPDPHADREAALAVAVVGDPVLPVRSWAIPVCDVDTVTATDLTWHCSRDRGHDGQHVATTGRTVVVVWPQNGEAP